MKRDYFEKHEDLAEYMIEKAIDDIYVVAVLFYDDTMKLIRELMCFEDVDFGLIDIEPPDWDGYDKEYYIQLNSDLVANIEPAFRESGYLSAEGDLTLVDGEASSSILPHIEEGYHEIYIGKSEENVNYDKKNEEDNENEDKELESILINIIFK